MPRATLASGEVQRNCCVRCSHTCCKALAEANDALLLGSDHRCCHKTCEVRTQ